MAYLLGLVSREEVEALRKQEYVIEANAGTLRGAADALFTGEDSEPAGEGHAYVGLWVDADVSTLLLPNELFVSPAEGASVDELVDAAEARLRSGIRMLRRAKEAALARGGGPGVQDALSDAQGMAKDAVALITSKDDEAEDEE